MKTTHDPARTRHMDPPLRYTGEAHDAIETSFAITFRGCRPAPLNDPAEREWPNAENE